MDMISTEVDRIEKSVGVARSLTAVERKIKKRLREQQAII
jgi:hypothetical protein